MISQHVKLPMLGLQLGMGMTFAVTIGATAMTATVTEERRNCNNIAKKMKVMVRLLRSWLSY